MRRDPRTTACWLLVGTNLILLALVGVTAGGWQSCHTSLGRAESSLREIGESTGAVKRTMEKILQYLEHPSPFLGEEGRE